MFEPVRGGTRGGQAEFKWSDVSADKDRENYLGHSINAPTGRWQKNKDVHWYNRDKTQAESERLEEIRKIKELEADALAVALGFEPAKKPVTASSPTAEKATDASPSASTAGQVAIKKESKDEQRALEKEEKRRRKEARREEKRARKETHRLERGSVRHAVEDVAGNGHQRRGDRSRSRSPRRRSWSPRRRSRSPRPSRLDARDIVARRTSHSRSRSRTPVRRLPRRDSPDGKDYRADDRERERERDRRRWDLNSRRDQPSGARRYD